MNRKDARDIAHTITNEQLKLMFDNAKVNVEDWTVVSICNKGFTKGVAWNILARNFKMNYNYHIVAKTNMIREFGKYLPDELKPLKKDKKDIDLPVHQDPIF